MTFPRALLLSALLGSIATAAPTPSKCDLDLNKWGAITFDGAPLSLGSDGDIVIGGSAINFVGAVCQSQGYGYRGLESQNEGYLVNANDVTQCLTASNLDQSSATFSLQDCGFNEAGDVFATQSFAWNFDNSGAEQTASGWFNGENFNAVNSSQPPIYSFKAQYDKPDFDGKRGKLMVRYTPDLKSLPASIQIPETNAPVHAPEPSRELTCGSHSVGQMKFSNMTSSSNQYDGPLNAKWEAQADTSDTFVFEQCDFSSSGLKDDAETVYGRIRPGSDLQDGGFNCYSLTGPSNDGVNKPVDGAWINGFQLNGCSYTGAAIFKLNKETREIAYLPFGNGSQPGVLAAYTQLDYDAEYDVKQYVWDDAGIGLAYVAPDNQNLTKYPPGKITFDASS